MTVHCTLDPCNAFHFSGLTPEMASKMASDYNAVMSFEEKDKKMHFDYDSKLSPMKYSFNWNTEFEHELNMLPGKVFKVMMPFKGMS